MTATALHSHEDRDAIKARAEADFLNLFEEHGGRRRGKALQCPFHDDKNPSASIHKGRFHCFGCNLSLDVFGFIEKAQGTDFRGALSYLADRYGVPMNNRVLTRSEKREYAEAQRIREEAAYFAEAAAQMAELALEGLPDNHAERFELTNLLAALRVSPESQYRAWLTRNPQMAEALVEAGRGRDQQLQVALARWIAGGMSEVADAA